MTRRAFVSTAAASLAAAPRSVMGVASPSFMTTRRFPDTIAFVEHCHSLGAAGAQVALSSHQPEYLQRLERRLKDLGMYMEVISGLPKPDMTAFVQVVESARRIGALCIRSACLGDRRYEKFSTLDEWKQFVADSRAAIARAVPVAEKYRMPLAIENHKDWTADEMAAIMRQYSSDYFGVCLDTGNNMSLLDEPMDVVKRLAPYALSTHLKDMGVDRDPDGFLLSEVVFGEGVVDMRKAVAIIRQARPRTRLSIEMITRNPLKVPCLTERYWTTFPDRSGRYLGRMLKFVETNRRKLPVIDGLDPAALARLEDDNVRRCLATSVL